MSHLKRQSAPKSWPIPRKGTTFVVKPNFGFSNGIPLLVLLRDMLKITKDKKEVKKAIHFKNILVNGKEVRDEKYGVLLFDVITIIPTKKNYRLLLNSKGKFELKEIKENEAEKKVAKVIGKKMLRQKVVQLNLSDGRNFISDIKCKTNDSVLVDFKKKKIEKCIPLKENSNVFVFAGKHAGTTGRIEKIKEERKMATIESDTGKVHVLIKQFMVVE